VTALQTAESGLALHGFRRNIEVSLTKQRTKGTTLLDRFHRAARYDTQTLMQVPESADVLKVLGNVKPDALAGRLENLVTGRQQEFASDD
jgi:hypothetical protein